MQTTDLSRRAFALSTLALAVGAPHPARAGLTGRAAAMVPVGSQGDSWWQRYIRKLADAGLNMEYLIRGELGNEETMVSGLRRGRVGVIGVSDWAATSVVPELGVIGLPYLFDSDDEFNHVLDNYVWDRLAALFAARDIIMVQWLNMGFVNLYSMTPVVEPEDAAGMKLRAALAPGTDRFLRALGADPVQLGVADVTPALQTGLVQGGLASTVMHWALTADLAPHYTLTRHAYNLTGIFASARWLTGASPAERAAVSSGLDDIAVIRAENLAEQQRTLEQMVSQKRVTIHELTTEQRARWQEKTVGIHQEVVAQIGGEAAAIYAAIQAGKRDYAASVAGLANAAP